MEIILTIGYASVFSFMILKWKWFIDNQVHKFLFVSLFVLKILTGIFAMELYEYRYQGGDAISFIQFSKPITESFYKNPVDFLGMVTGVGDDEEFMKKHGVISGWNNMDVVYNDNRTILRINGFIGLFSMGYSYIHIVFFAFISMMGLMGIYKASRLLTTRSPYLLVLAVFLVPGVMFWLSMTAKESILIFAMGMFFYHCIRLLTISNSFGNMAGMFLAGFLFIHIKAYLLILITPCLLAFTWVSVTNNKYSFIKYGIVYVSCLMLIFNAKYLLNGFDPMEILFMKRLNFEAFADAFPKDMGSYIELPYFNANWGSILTAAPVAAFSVLTRPYVWESTSILILLSALENIVLMLALLWGLKNVSWEGVVKNKNYLFFCIYFVLSVFILIGLTTPAMGAIVRYKVPVLPFLCLIPILISGKRNPVPKT